MFSFLFVIENGKKRKVFSLIVERAVFVDKTAHMAIFLFMF